jgi:hypothetical protein
MRKALCLSVFFTIVSCGPDPNAVLPGMQPVTPSGGKRTASGGSSGSGAGGTKISAGGATGSTGGAASGGASSKGGTVGAGGAVGNGGVGGAGGSASGTGGTTSAGTGVLSVYTFGSGTEPCSSPKDVSGGHSGNLGTGAVCLRTADDFTDWNCNNMDDRTIKINGVETKCGAAPPAKVGSFYYFDVSAGATAWAAFSWFCTKLDCGPHSIPSCGSYPTWVSGGSAGPCSTSPTSDASISTTVDGGSSSIDSGTTSAIDAG